MIDGRDPEAMDIEGRRKPSLVHLAREKRLQHFHNFKAGAMNALIRVSLEINNGPIIMHIDCEIHSNNLQSIRNALCFFSDEEKGHEVVFVKFPQSYHNLTKNELYGGTMRVVYEFEFHGLDDHGDPSYIEIGYFHRGDTIFGSTFEGNGGTILRKGDGVTEVEESVKQLSSCTFEKNTQWRKEMGLKYGCRVEDMITGLSI